MAFTLGLPEISLGVILFGALQYLASLWISERLKTSLRKEHSAFLENLKWEVKVREQAVRVAEYLALARSLKENSPDSDTEWLTKCYGSWPCGSPKTFTNKWRVQSPLSVNRQMS